MAFPFCFFLCAYLTCLDVGAIMNYPAPHGVQLAFPLPENLPASDGEQLHVSAKRLYVPAPHARHANLSVSAVSPMTHAQSVSKQLFIEEGFVACDSEAAGRGRGTNAASAKRRDSNACKRPATWRRARTPPWWRAMRFGQKHLLTENSTRSQSEKQ